jgi:hypothetical protein
MKYFYFGLKKVFLKTYNENEIFLKNLNNENIIFNGFYQILIFIEKFNKFLLIILDLLSFDSLKYIQDIIHKTYLMVNFYINFFRD